MTLPRGVQRFAALGSWCSRTQAWAAICTASQGEPKGGVYDRSSSDMPSTVISWKMAVANSIDPFGRLGASGADQLGAEQLAGDGVAGDADVDGLGAVIRHLRRHSGAARRRWSRPQPNCAGGTSIMVGE